MEKLIIKPRVGDEYKIVIDKSTLIAAGGEGGVHINSVHPKTRCVKRLHAPSLQRAEKIQWFVGQDLGLPDRIVVPTEVASTESGEIVGFGMHQLGRRFEKFKSLFDPDYCTANKITARFTTELMLTTGTDLTQIHKFGKVGDLNDGGLLFTPGDIEPRWVDTDSFDVPGHPCQVGTQLYLCPALYGVDLAKGSARFETWHDWYSFSVLLFRALLRKHPFKAGTHPKFTSILARAENGLTILDQGVTYPPVGLRPEMLSNALTDILLAYLKGQRKDPFPLDNLRQYRDELVDCKSCGVQFPHSRKKCPQCSTVTTAKVITALGVEVLTMIESRGHIVHVQIQGSTIFCFAEEDGSLVLYRKDQNAAVIKVELKLAYSGRMRFGIFGMTLVISTDSDPDSPTGDLFLLDLSSSGVTPIKKTSTNIFSGKAPVFATSRRYLYRLAGNSLLCCERMGSTVVDEIVTSVFQNQSWFTCDPNASANEVLFGLNRDVARNEWFLCTSGPDGRKFKTRTVAIPALDRGESLQDLAVRFSGKSILLVRRTKISMDERVRIERVDVDSAAVTSSESFALSERPHLDRVKGMAFHRGVVVVPTDSGIVHELLDTAAAQTLGGTETISSQDDTLFVYGNGMLSVRHNRVYLVNKS